ncbi:glycosyltransferase family 4 protein [Micromonospora coerulea]|uniref:glycosyltransferase family 4 protein n=1 Tax=Micromonospora coerulea TaxID=47856 RepID=UPI0019048840|nr:glycosyltransferase family 4 protein [Micromonospora veneta]
MADPAGGRAGDEPGRARPGAVPPVVLLLAPAQSVHTRRWASALAGRGHRVVVTSWVAAEPLPDVELRVPGGGGAVPGGPLGGAWRLLATGWWLRRQVRQIRPDVVHVHSVGRGGLLSLALPRGAARVVTPWGSELRTATGSRLRRWVTRHAFRRADLVLPTSASLTAEVTTRYRIPTARTATLSWGVDDALLGLRDTVRRSEVRREFGVPAGATVLLSMRGTAPVYRTDDILGAYAHAARERPDLHLVLLAGHEPAEAVAAGERGAALDRAAALAAALPGRVTVVRRTLSPRETFALMCASDVAVSVPRSDQRSSAVLEAALAGCRLLLADLPPYRELLADGLVADLVGEPLRTGLAGLLRTAGPLPPTDQRANRRFIETSETWSRQVSAMQSHYRRLTVGRPGAHRHRGRDDTEERP